MTKNLGIETNIKTIGRLIDDIKSGNVCVPPFQREFVWERDNIKDLFDSIKNNYPIGSILLWKPAEKMQWQCMHQIGPYTVSVNSDQEWYVLDGFQRLSSIFGCLTNPTKCELEYDRDLRESLFSLYYDLKSEEFLYLRNSNSFQPYQVPIYVLMSSSDFRQYFRSHMEPVLSADDIDKYLDKADSLSSRFLEYRIACIEISNAHIEQAVDIFSRLNSKGVDISFDWMVNALSYKDGSFQFAEEISSVIKSLKQFNFETISRNALFRCVQSGFGKLYIDQPDIERLARRDDFQEVTRSILPIVIKSVEFLHNELYVQKYQLLPYNTQLIFIVEFFKQLPNPTDSQIQKLKLWFWKTTYSSYFTINTLSFQRTAYKQFTSFLQGNEVDPFYEDDDQTPYSTVEFPKQISLRGVRSRALVIFLLNQRKEGKLATYSNLELLDSEEYNEFVKINKMNIINDEQLFVESIGLKYTIEESALSLSEAIDSILTKQNKDFQNSMYSGSVSFDYKKNNGIFYIGTGKYLFATMWTECGNNSIYCYSDKVKRIGYNPQCVEFPPLSSIVKDFDFSSRCKAISVNNVVVLENREGHFAAIRINKIERNNSDLNHLLEFEYKIYVK